jgi:hypothetical protein
VRRLVPALIKVPVEARDVVAAREAVTAMIEDNQFDRVQWQTACRYRLDCDPDGDGDGIEIIDVEEGTV